MKIVSIITAFLLVFGFSTSVQAESFYYQAYPEQPYTHPNNGVYMVNQGSSQNNAYIQELLNTIKVLQQKLLSLQNNNQGVYTYPNQNYSTYTAPYTWNQGTYSYQNESSQEPSVETDRARDISTNSAELLGEVDMNEFNNGLVFFVYGQDEDAIEDVADDYDEYDDVLDDTEDDEFEVVKVDNDLDDDDEYEKIVSGLERDQEYFFTLCVEYEDEDGDETLTCGEVEDFDTDN